MAGQLKWMGVAAGTAVLGAAPFAAQAGFGGSAGEGSRPMVQLPPAAPVASGGVAKVSAPAAAASLTVTVGGYTYDWTALQTAIDADSEVPNGYFIVADLQEATLGRLGRVAKPVRLGCW
ncbi:hypothetical protein ACWPMX_11120 [Tsuneonella sp. HG094]